MPCSFKTGFKRRQSAGSNIFGAGRNGDLVIRYSQRTRVLNPFHKFYDKILITVPKKPADAQDQVPGSGRSYQLFPLQLGSAVFIKRIGQSVSS